MKNILFVSAECVPFIKTGGLADVVGSLPKSFDKEYFDCRVILPKYLCMDQYWKDRINYRLHFYMDYGGESRYVGVEEIELEGITFYFIDNEYYFAGDRPYGNNHWDIEKFIFFSKAALSALPLIGFKPDVVHCHDWQTGLVPVYLKDSFRGGDFFKDIKSVMTVHNLKFQGNENIGYIQYLSGLSDYYFTDDKLKAYQDANLLKGGLVYADAITTVSPSYAEEIKTRFYGEGLDGLLAARTNDLRGIVNGIDYKAFNPELDENIYQEFNVKNFRENKIINKRELQKELGLDQDDNIFMVGIISRLTDQKGFDLISQVMEEICNDYIQVVVLGTGDKRYEDMFNYFAWKYPGKVSANIYYSEPMSHKIYAACDAFLMPSLFEPCGLSQLMALRYGTIPIVRETGGLRDTVIPLNEFEEVGTGFGFKNYNPWEMLETVKYARYIFCDRRVVWDNMVERAMQEDNSWENSAKKYQEMYDWLLGW